MTVDDEFRRAEIVRKLRDTDGVIASLKKAARQAVVEHARAGQPIVIWRDGQVVLEDANAVLARQNAERDASGREELPDSCEKTPAE